MQKALESKLSEEENIRTTLSFNMSSEQTVILVPSLNKSRQTRCYRGGRSKRQVAPRSVETIDEAKRPCDRRY